MSARSLSDAMERGAADAPRPEGATAPLFLLGLVSDFGGGGTAAAPPKS
jgi:hypothetical protein